MSVDKVADPLARELIESRVALRNRLIKKGKIPQIKVSQSNIRSHHSNWNWIHRVFSISVADEQHILRNIRDNCLYVV